MKQDRDSRQEGRRVSGGERVGFGGTHGSLDRAETQRW